MNRATFQSASGFSRTLASLECFPLSCTSCLQQRWEAVLPLMFGFPLLRSAADWGPRRCSSHVNTKSHHNGCAVSKSVARCCGAGEARWRLLCSSCRSEIWRSSQPFTVIVLGQSVCVLQEQTTTKFFTLKKEYRSKGRSVRQVYMEVWGINISELRWTQPTQNTTRDKKERFVRLYFWMIQCEMS